jgi:hypothetical protein
MNAFSFNPFLLSLSRCSSLDGGDLLQKYLLAYRMLEEKESEEAQSEEGVEERRTVQN